jgi:Cu2+-exporting ATPase
MSASKQSCFHCAQPVPDEVNCAVEINGVSQSMCCHGCQAVAQAIVDAGLTDFYAHRTGPVNPPEELVPEALQTMELFDQPSLQAGFVSTDEQQLKHASLILEGISCAACVWLSERHVRALPGIREFQVNYSTHRAHVSWDDNQLKLSDILRAIHAIGYVAHPFDPGRQEQVQKKERSQALRRLFVAGLATVQVMMLAVAMYAGDHTGMEPSIERFMRWISLLLTLPVLFYAASGFFTNAWNDARRGRVGMDTPVSLALGSAFSASLWHTWTGQGEIYYDSVCMFSFFLLISRYLEMQARHRAGQAAEALVKLLPASATLLQDGRSKVVAVSELRPGDEVLIKPGETVPADGVVMDGQSSVNESLLTGESLPRLRATGDKLVGGSLNVESPLQMRVESVGEETLIAGIARLLDRAQTQKPELARLADHIAGYFVVGLLLIAGIVALAWWHWDPTRAFEITLAVLVVSCPCALSLATPTAITAATGALTKAGLLITRGHVLETLGKIQHVVFDKTGTLTQGNLVLVQQHTLADLSDQQALAIAAALSQGSAHPVAKALMQQADDTDLRVKKLSSQPGYGMQGEIEGEIYRLGHAAYVAELAKTSPPSSARLSGAQVYLGNQQSLLAHFELADQLRTDARESMDLLHQQNLQIHILSGDNIETVTQVADVLQVDAYKAEQRPADKLNYVNALQKDGAKVLMVGDGVNDAPVLAGANVSIAMGQGAQLAQASADALMLSERLQTLPLALDKARATRNVIRQNLTWALLYNLSAIPLAASGLITAWMAAIGMSLSSLVVVLNATRLR